MAITINDNLKVNAPKALDNKYGKFIAGVWQPFDSIAEAQTAVVLAYRHKGLTQLILKNSVPVEYWYKDGITDPDLVVKFQDNIKEIRYSVTFTGATGSGEIGNITLPNFDVPTGYFIDEVLVDVGAGLTGIGAILNLGITTDGIQSGLNDITGEVSTLNTNGITKVSISSFIKATVNRVIVMEVKTANITAGTILIFVKLSKL